MLDVSSPGRVAPKAKTINVQANLLAERLAERERLREAIVKRIALLATVLLLAIVILPFLYKLNKASLASAASAKSKEATLQKELEGFEQQKSSAEPVLAEQQMMEKVRKQAEAYLGQVTLFFNGATPDMAFVSVKCEVVGGEMKVSAKAEAENYKSAHGFVESSSQGPGVKDVVLISVRRSGQLSPEGVTVDMVKRLGLGL